MATFNPLPQEEVAEVEERDATHYRDMKRAGLWRTVASVPPLQLCGPCPLWTDGQDMGDNALR